MSARSPRRDGAAATSRPRRLRWMASALALLVLAGGTAWWLSTRPAGTADRPPAAAAPAVPAAATTPRDQGTPVALPSTPPVAVPAAVVADAPGLPHALPPVALAATSELPDGVHAHLVEVRSVDAHGRLPGEVSGPALRVTVQLTNTASSPASLDGVAVNLYTGSDGVPSAPVTEQSGARLHGSLAPGASAQGVYAFTVPDDRRDQVTVTVAVGPQVGTAVFSGPVR